MALKQLVWILPCVVFLVKECSCHGFHGFGSSSSPEDLYYYYDYIGLIPSSEEVPDCVELTATDTIQYFTSHPTYDGATTTYEQYSRLCWWVTAQDSEKTVELTTDALDLVEDGKFHTCSDYVSFYDGRNMLSVPILFADCAVSGTLPTMNTLGNVMMIVFHAGGNTNPGLGFRMGYRQVEPPSCEALNANSSIQTFSSHSGTGNYPSEYLDCWNMTFDAAMVEISSENHHFDVEYAPMCAFDKLAIGEVSSDLVSWFCGRTDRTNFYIDKIRFCEPVHIAFRTDRSEEFSGFELEYYTRDCQYLSSTCGSFVSHDEFNHEPYRHNWYDCWLIESDSPITLNFTLFDVEEETDCGYDFVKVYDGASKEDPLLGIYCGSDLPEPVTSTGGALFVEFKTDPLAKGYGFKAEYKSRDNCCTPRLSPSSGRRREIRECMINCLSSGDSDN